jgi:hypothetical protein
LRTRRRRRENRVEKKREKKVKYREQERTKKREKAENQRKREIIGDRKEEEGKKVATNGRGRREADRVYLIASSRHCSCTDCRAVELQTFQIAVASSMTATRDQHRSGQPTVIARTSQWLCGRRPKSVTSEVTGHASVVITSLAMWCVANVMASRRHP